MKFCRDTRLMPAPRAVTIGAFDGLHIGHQGIFARLVEAAGEVAGPACVLSFEPLPSEVLALGEPPARLTCFRERYRYLEYAGIDEFYCARFAAIRRLSAEQFIERILVGCLAARHVVVGHDFRFGAGRAGSLDDLRAAGRSRGFDVTVVEPVEVDGVRVSSTAIRAALVAGDLAAARRMLGRDYSMTGRVVRGLGLGRQLGYPTANVNLDRRRSPIDGIFAVRVGGAAFGAARLDGVASVGTRPTVGGGQALLEVMVFDFDGDLYGTEITVHFIRRLREERHFSGLEELKAQMALDVVEAREALAGRA